MKLSLLTPDALRIVDWLGEVGPRWGLPREACRVHALLFLLARPVPGDAIASQLALTSGTVDDALAWLRDEGLVADGDEGWSTEADPWVLIVQAHAPGARAGAGTRGAGQMA